jgi:hypothetical protein
MKRLMMWAMLALSAGCPKQGSTGPTSGASAVAMAGEWRDESGTHVSIEARGGQPFVRKIIDSDGEVFPVAGQGYTNGKFQWIYEVPSTGYVVTIVVEGMSGDRVIHTSWSNDHDMSGTEDMFRDR